MKFISYQEWRGNEEARLLALNEEVRCEGCSGEGEMECECTCGHNHETECEDCNGLGTYRFSDLSRPQYSHLRDKHLSLEIYEKVVLEEAKQLASYVARDVFEVLVESGFHPWMTKWKHDKSIRLLSPESRR